MARSITRVSLVREDDAARIARQTRDRERQVRGGDPGRAAPPRMAGGAGLIRVKLTSAVTVLSGTTPGSGTCVRVAFNGTSLVDGTTSEPIRNDSTVAGTSGKRGWATYQDGTLWLVVADC